MKKRFAPAARFALALTVATDAFAHAGHGLDAPHWHATDVAGLLLVVVLATLAIWLSRD